MFWNKPEPEPTRLDLTIESVYDDLNGMTSDTENFAHSVDQLTKLHKLKHHDAPQRVSKETMATIAANLGGILLILNHERAHVVATKALGFVSKAR